MAVLCVDECRARCCVLRVINGLSVRRKNRLAEFFLMRLGRFLDELYAFAAFGVIEPNFAGAEGARCREMLLCRNIFPVR